MTNRNWLAKYPKGVPADIDPAQYTSIVALMDESFAKYAARDAYSCMDKRLSFAALDRYSTAVAAWLQAKGLKRGDRVAIMMPNVLQYPVVMAGVLRAGMTVVNVNPLYTPRELEHQLKDSGATAIVILENFAKTLEQVVARTPVKLVVVATMGDMLGALKGMIVNTVVRRVKKLVPAAKSGVMRDIPDGETVLGYPAAPDKQAKRQWIAAAQLPDALRRLKNLEKRLGDTAEMQP